MLLVVGLASGGYFPRTWRLTTIAFLTLLAASLVGRERIALSRLERGFLLLLAAFAGWMELSRLWSDAPLNSVLEGERALVYVTGATAMLLTLERTQLLGLLVGALAGVTTASAVGLGRYVIGGHELNPIQGNLLFEPIGYANALGLYAAIGILLALGLALALETRWQRLAVLSTLLLLGPTLYLTASRAASFALVLGLLVLLRLAPGVPRAVFAATALCALAFGAVVGVLGADASGVAGRLFGENRPRYWGVALEQYGGNVVLGSGAGTFDRYWIEAHGFESFARDAHSLYLETLAELGPLGLALLLCALALPLSALRGPRDTLIATAAGGYVAFLVHAGVDWDWELPAVTLTGLLCGTALLVSGRPPDAPALGGPLRVALLVAAVAFAALALYRLDAGPGLPFAS